MPVAAPESVKLRIDPASMMTVLLEVLFELISMAGAAGAVDEDGMDRLPFAWITILPTPEVPPVCSLLVSFLLMT